MGFLTGKRFLITGVHDTSSLAYGIAEAMDREGAELAFSYKRTKNYDRVYEVTKKFNSNFCYKCNVDDDQEIAELFAHLEQHWDGLDGIVHSIAWAPPKAFGSSYTESTTREIWNSALETSAYSLTALVKAGLPMMRGRNASILTNTYIGSQIAVPNYNIMGIVKASLEATVRYLANDLGPQGIRVNALSEGPHLTAAFGDAIKPALEHYAKHSPLRRNITIQEVGNAAAFLCSDLASAITGQTIVADGGFSISDRLHTSN
jgi:enoyl-[acyl-carrier protein] reductase I